MIVYKSNLRNLGSVNTPYSERFGPVPRCSLFRGLTVVSFFDNPHAAMFWFRVENRTFSITSHLKKPYIKISKYVVEHDVVDHDITPSNKTVAMGYFWHVLTWVMDAWFIIT